MNQSSSSHDESDFAQASLNDGPGEPDYIAPIPQWFERYLRALSQDDKEQLAVFIAGVHVAKIMRILDPEYPN